MNEWVCVGRWACTCSVCTLRICHLSLCKCYASTKEKRSILTSFVSWKSNSIFSDQGVDRVLILYPKVVKECGVIGVCVVNPHLDRKKWITEQSTEKHILEKENKNMVQCAAKEAVKNIMNSCPGGNH